MQLEEITAGLKEVLGHVKGSLQVFEDILSTLDKNLNGKVDYTEFLTAAANKEQLLVEDNLKFAFNMFDEDRNGCISRKELRAVFETAEKKDETLWNEIFQEVDTDGDGVITFQEFKDSMQKVIKKSDEKYLIRGDSNDAPHEEPDDMHQNISDLILSDPKKF